MPDKPWKRAERSIGAAFGIARLPSNGHAQPDLRILPGTGNPHNGFGVESKAWSKVPKILYDALDQARVNAANGEHPVVIVSEARGEVKAGAIRHKPRRFVLMDFETFCDLFAPEKKGDVPDGDA
jgi:hypothetical protein